MRTNEVDSGNNHLLSRRCCSQCHNARNVVDNGRYDNAQYFVIWCNMVPQGLPESGFGLLSFFFLLLVFYMSNSAIIDSIPHF
jgi:hypothetical protein